jgi:tetratricopeptide (TPR) repeat protein
LERYEDELKCYNKAIEINSSNELFWNYKGYCLTHLGRYEESLAETEKNISAYQLFFGDDNSSCFDQLVLKYRNCLKLNKTGEAEETKKEALRLGQKLYPAGSAKLRNLIR